MFRISRVLLTGMAVSLLAGSIAACGGDSTAPVDPGPTAGTLTVTLATPESDDGGILFTVTGPGMSQVASADGSLYFRHSQEGATITAALIGDVTAGALLTFRVPDIDAKGSYAATAVAVTDRENELKGSLAGYALTVN